MQNDVIIDETKLAAFRNTQLAPERLYELLPQDGAILVVDTPPGVGKTQAAHRMIETALNGRHDLVVYVAPTRALLEELIKSDVFDDIKADAFVLEPRPRWLCGPLDAAWGEMEVAGCSGLAKASLCGECPHQRGCGWPDQYDKLTEGIRLVVLTEQYLSINPDFLQMIRTRINPGRPLLILDEASNLTQGHTRNFTLDQMRKYVAILQKGHTNRYGDQVDLSREIRSIRAIMSDPENPRDWPSFSSFGLTEASLSIQEIGFGLFGKRFRNIGRDLTLMSIGRSEGRWCHEDAIHFHSLPDTKGYDVSLFSPYLPLDVIEERLGRPVIAAIPPTIFRHSQTRFMNITDSIGTFRSIQCDEHFGRACDFMAALVLKVKLSGGRSVVICKKGLINRVSKHLQDYFEDAGIDMVVTSNTQSDDIAFADCVLINYGIVGVNALSGFDAAFCFGGYYAQPDHVHDVYWQALPQEARPDQVLGVDGTTRAVMATSPGIGHRHHARQASTVLQMLERRIVLQAVGRVRPFTTPAIVVLFQMDDFSDVLGEVTTFKSLAEARRLWNVPTRAQVRTARLSDAVRHLSAAGASYRTLAGSRGVSVSTIHKAMHAPGVAELIGKVQL